MNRIFNEDERNPFWTAPEGHGDVAHIENSHIDDVFLVTMADGSRFHLTTPDMPEGVTLQ